MRRYACVYIITCRRLSTREKYIMLAWASALLDNPKSESNAKAWKSKVSGNRYGSHAILLIIIHGNRMRASILNSAYRITHQAKAKRRRTQRNMVRLKDLL